MSRKWEELIGISEKTMSADGFDDAIIGTVERYGDAETIILYDKDKVIEILMADMSEEDAVEHFYFNIIGAYVGEGTPAFATLLKLDENGNKQDIQ
jgi:hypothetical protein